MATGGLDTEKVAAEEESSAGHVPLFSMQETPTSRVFSGIGFSGEARDHASDNLEVIRLKREVEKLRREAIEMRHKQTTGMVGLHRCYGLLREFTTSQTVRREYLAGRLTPVYSGDMLAAIDDIAGILMPRPGGPSHDAVRYAMICATNLMAQSNLEFVHADGSPFVYRQSFAGWRRCFQELLNCRQWTDGFAAQNQWDYNGLEEGFGKLATGDRKVPLVSPTRQSSPIAREHTYGRPTSRAAEVKREFAFAGYEGASSESSESGTSEGAGISGTDGTNERRGRNNRRRRKMNRSSKDGIAQLLRALQVPKEVVPPAKWDPSSACSFREFLLSYEEYFDAKFQGGEKERSRQLRGFLVGSAGSAYDAVGGANIRYRDLKPALLEWH